jgi:putative salt-induced outer membrane protein YdiY
MVGVRTLAAVLTLAFGVPGAASAASDIVITTTGDRLVGEIKKVEKDVLTLSTDYSDSDFKIKWDKIVSIQSDRQFLLETFAGKRIAGTLKPEGDKKATVQVADTSVTLPEISAVQPFERSFVSRFDAGFDLGYSKTRANDATQFSFGGNLSYRDQHHLDSLFVNVFRSSQSNAPDTNRWDLGNDFRRLLGDRWYVNTTQDLLNSDEQQLQLRTTLGGGGGRYLLRSASQYLALGGGLAWTNERYTDSAAPTTDSGEAYAGTEFMTERLKVVDVLTRFTWYPSLTIDSRYRINYKLNFDFNLPGDWYWRIGYFDNYDSLPPTATAKNDYGWSNAFGLKF